VPVHAFESKHDGLTALIKSTAEAVSEELKGRLEEEIRSSMPPEIASMPSDEAQQWLSWQVQWGLDEAISQAVSAAVVKEMGEVVTPVFGQELQLERRNYNAFALFGHGSRAQSGLRIKRLGCVRSGRPHQHALAARARHVHEVTRCIGWPLEMARVGIGCATCRFLHNPSALTRSFLLFRMILLPSLPPLCRVCCGSCPKMRVVFAHAHFLHFCIMCISHISWHLNAF